MRVLSRPVLILILCALASVAKAQTTGPDTVADVAAVLGKLAVVVVVVESALAAIFNWRVYRMVFNDRALKTPVMFGVGLLIVLGFQYDVFADLMQSAAGRVFGDGPWRTALSTILSALIIAGGSSGVNELFKRLGLRNPLPEKSAQPVLNEKQAYVSIHVTRLRAVGPIQVYLREVDLPDSNPLAGTVDDSTLGSRLRAAFASDSMRFPNYGGHTLKAFQGYDIGLRFKETGAADVIEQSCFKGSLASRAIIDFSFTA